MSLQQNLEKALERHQAGDIAAATDLYRAVLTEQADHPDALHMLGVIAQQKGNPELALKLVSASLAKKPKHAMAWCNRCIVLRVLERKQEALESAKEAIAIEPNLADGWDLAGSLLRELGQSQESCRYHERAVALQPDNMRFQANYVVALLAADNLIAAYNIVREIYRRDPKLGAFPLANILKGAGYPERAARYYEETARLMPDYADASVQAALCHLLIGDMKCGWTLWEKRPPMTKIFEHIPKWNGGKVKHLLLYEEQGMGDALQGIRYIPLIRDRCEKITLQLTGYLRDVLIPNLSGVDVITLDDPVPLADARIQLLSLPSLMGTQLDSIPAPIPYMKTFPEWQSPWAERLAKISKPKIGLVWGGNPANTNDKNRSLHFSQLDPLIKAAASHLVSLQKGKQKEQADFANAGIYDAEPFMNDFTATAGLIAELDLIITVDTAVAHLAGALGKPVWMLIPFDPDWRWLLGREDSPWYPHLRLFRQTEPRNWSPVIERVTDNTKRLIAADQSVLKPAAWVGLPLRYNPNAIVLPGMT